MPAIMPREKHAEHETRPTRAAQGRRSLGCRNSRMPKFASAPRSDSCQDARESVVRASAISARVVDASKARVFAAARAIRWVWMAVMPRVRSARVGGLHQFGEFGGFGLGEDSGVDDAVVGGPGLVMDPGLFSVFVRAPADRFGGCGEEVQPDPDEGVKGSAAVSYR